VRSGVVARRAKEDEGGVVFAVKDALDGVAGGADAEHGDIVRALAEDGVGFDAAAAGGGLALDVLDVGGVVDEFDLLRCGGLPGGARAALDEAAVL
jgi:hypothetical protein